MNWTYLHGNWVLCPPSPRGIIHFLGGAFVATAPQLTYQWYLESLANQGFCIIAAPFLVQPNHQAIAAEVAQSFRFTHATLQKNQQVSSRLPIFGIGHSLGSKLQLLLTCEGNLPRAGNILISFNNSSSDRAIPFAEWVTPIIPLEFYPSPEETLDRVQNHYQQPHTLILRFKTDSLDESQSLTPILKTKFPETFMDQALAGDHLTPLGQDLSSSGSASVAPLGQWLNREVFTKRSRLETITVKWLNYQQQSVYRSRKI